MMEESSVGRALATDEEVLGISYRARYRLIGGSHLGCRPGKFLVRLARRVQYGSGTVLFVGDRHTIHQTEG